MELAMSQVTHVAPGQETEHRKQHDTNLTIHANAWWVHDQND